MRFIKFHGYGNDYLVFESAELADAGGLGEFGDFARRVCDRHFGAGADGVALLSPDESAEADFALRIFNADGSEAAMSGNGSRCAVSYLYFQRLWPREELRLKTAAGVKLYRLRERIGEGRYRFEAEIGQPRFDSASVPFRADEPLDFVRDYPLALPSGETVSITALQMCNPNCCVFVEDFESVDWRTLGALIEPHERFPERTNVAFVRVRDPRTIEVRMWERGVGETLSSGTGACASAVAASLKGLTERRVRVEMAGGNLEVFWRDDGEALLTGEAEVVYRGEWMRDERREREVS
ncbi:MAG TPA: diaminopimelate epimerase [Pyrinomonadaceae bacterium]|jgi:diaminopimelate epimerase